MVDYVLIGAVAVAAHGYLRTTADADIVPDPDHDNLRRLGLALVSLNATLPLSADAAFAHSNGRALERRRNLTLETSQGALDIVQDARGVPSYATLNAAAVNLKCSGSRYVSARASQGEEAGRRPTAGQARPGEPAARLNTGQELASG